MKMPFPDVSTATQMFNDMPNMAMETYKKNIQGLQAIKAATELPVGQTPKELVWSLNKTKLYRYRPEKPVAGRIPLLLVYALINKPYIFDLQPGQSFIEFLLDYGFEIYLLDWGSPGPEDKGTTFVDYATVYLPRAIRKMLRVAQATEFNMLGYCIGGTLSSIYAALNPDAPLRNLILLTTPTDFSKREENIFAGWADERYFDLAQMVNAFTNIPADLVEASSKMLKPVENYVSSYKILWDRLDNEAAVTSWQAIHKWMHDGVPFAGAAFEQWIQDFVRDNKLIKGALVVHGKRVDLTNITVPVLNILAKNDHIVPPSHALTIMDAIGSTDKSVEIIPAGHVGVMVSRGAKHNLWPKIVTWLTERA